MEEDKEALPSKGEAKGGIAGMNGTLTNEELMVIDLNNGPNGSSGDMLESRDIVWRSRARFLV